MGGGALAVLADAAAGEGASDCKGADEELVDGVDAADEVEEGVSACAGGLHSSLWVDQLARWHVTSQKYT